jgi:hypothetical protein
MSSSRSPRRLALLLLAVGTLLVGPLVGSAAAQSDAPASDDTVQTTSTLPTDNRELGNSLPKPGQGMEPQDPGDPGGWLQQSLFFLICTAIVVISLLVWRSSRKARGARSAAGQDPVSLARARGEGVRAAPKDPG